MTALGVVGNALYCTSRELQIVNAEATIKQLSSDRNIKRWCYSR